jgi:hypothetical protein
MSSEFDYSIVTTLVFLTGALSLTVWMGKVIKTLGANFLKDAYTEPEEEKSVTTIVDIAQITYYFITLGTILAKASNKFSVDSWGDAIRSGLGEIGYTMFGVGTITLIIWGGLAFVRNTKKNDKLPKQPWE